MLLQYDPQHWITFISAALLLNISPGPDLGFILAHTVRGGRVCGFAAMLGVWTGAMGHALFAAAGLSALLAASATAYSLVKYAGAAYLLWLGIQALRSRGAFSVPTAQAPLIRPGRIYAQGVFIDLLNPKAAIFFLAFLPQFVVAGAGPAWLQLLVHGVLIIVVAACVEPFFVLMGDRVSNSLRHSPRFCRWMDRGLGGFFLFLGLRLATSDR
ncbi:Threonine/homoserine/homoserine lactone efflux protein [Paucidesulfovibrio gracilis DSM 16080]|uniref:Threonine/homoserine/homoserine lactone efflux protein n=1 Tax=Paucidesulfovibrio gracilis DSM 16080 TaxID=1121449 RepID=A0A1T4Y5G0_9BACT|nr:LysE family translocator [Paucidesulfovibrio gracilis]SKA96970.1 Threonine/homoserine/homoserine lactone efflux protein [Paucidesulfovibrio gracilis DSM 16080]